MMCVLSSLFALTLSTLSFSLPCKDSNRTIGDIISCQKAGGKNIRCFCDCLYLGASILLPACSPLLISFSSLNSSFPPFLPSSPFTSQTHPSLSSLGPLICVPDRFLIPQSFPSPHRFSSQRHSFVLCGGLKNTEAAGPSPILHPDTVFFFWMMKPPSPPLISRYRERSKMLPICGVIPFNPLGRSLPGKII